MVDIQGLHVDVYLIAYRFLNYANQLVPFTISTFIIQIVDYFAVGDDDGIGGDYVERFDEDEEYALNGQILAFHDDD